MSRRIGALLAGLTLAGLALRWHGIGAMGLWYDEVALWQYALTGELPTFSEPPLMAHLLYAVMWWVRSADPLISHLVPALIGCLAVPLAYALAVQVSGRHAAGVAAAALVALSPMAIHYSREARPYALFIVLSGAVYLAFLRALERNTRWPWIVYGLLLYACGLAHLLSTEIVAALGVFTLTWLLAPKLSQLSRDARTSRFVRFALVSAAAALAGSLWASDRTDMVRAFTGLYATGPVAFVRDALQSLGPGPIFPNPSRWPSPLTELLCVAFLALYCVGLRELWKAERRPAALLLLLAVAVSLLVKYVTLGRRSGWDWARYATPALLPFLVSAGVGADRVRRWIGRPALQIAAFAGLGLAVLPVSLDPYRRDEYEEWRAVVRHLERSSGDLHGILFLPVEWRQPGPADLRIADTHQLLRKEALPRYFVNDWRIEEVALVPSRGGLALLPRSSGRPVASLAAGRYAMLSRRPLSDCGEIALRLQDIRVHSWKTEPVMKGLTVCHFDFAR